MIEDGDKRGERPATEIEEAMDWLLRLREAPDDPELIRAFERWRDGSPAHARAFDRAGRAWRVMGAVPPATTPVWWRGRSSATDAAIGSDAALRFLVSPGRRRLAVGRWALGLLGVAAGCVALALAAPAVRLHLEADHATSTAGRRDVRLSDGSRVTLGADSAIRDDFADGRRRVTLLAGEAFFDVLPDVARPFHVAAGGVEVAVVGTRFDVLLSSTSTSIEVETGSVSVSRPGRAAAETLAAGDRAVVDRGTGAVMKGRVAVAEVGAWRDGRLFVEDATIASVAEQLRRYHPAWIAISDPALSAERVTGLYDLRDPDRALGALVEPHGGRVRALSPYLRVLTRK